MLIDSFGNWPTLGQIFKAVATIVVAAVVVTAVVASAGGVGLAAGVIAAELGASGALVGAAITAGTVGTYVLATGISACALSNAGEILTGHNIIRDNILNGDQEAYDFMQYTLFATGVTSTYYGNLVNPTSNYSRGSTGRTEPRNLREKLAMEQVQSNPLEGAKELPIHMTDSRWPMSEGWVKMANNVNGIEIHFVYNKITHVCDDFKFKG